MNVSTITISQSEAAARLRNYKEIAVARRTAEDDALVRLYRSVLKGARVINLHAAFRETGLNEHGEPKLAVAREAMNGHDVTVAHVDHLPASALSEPGIMAWVPSDRFYQLINGSHRIARCLRDGLPASVYMLDPEMSETAMQTPEEVQVQAQRIFNLNVRF